MQQQQQRQQRQQQQQRQQRQQPPMPKPLQQATAAARLGQQTRSSGMAARQKQQKQKQSSSQAEQQVTGKQHSHATVPRIGQLRQQLKLLQQAQLQQAPATYAGLRAAAGSSTDLLLSLLNSQLPLLVGSAATAAAAGASPSAPAAAAAAELSARQRRALLREALVCIAWHCSTHQLLPAEAQRLQDLLLRQLLPALAPHVTRTRSAVLARVVLALGSCWASVWQPADGSSSGVDQQGSLADDSDCKEEGEEQAAVGDGDPSMKQQMPGISRSGRIEDPQQQQQQQGQQLFPKTNSVVNEQQDEGTHQQQQQQKQSVAALQQQQQQLSSSDWLRLLLPLLPPSQLSVGSLLSAWQGCALHELSPPGPWLAQASLTVYAALQQQKLDFNDTAALLQACAQLEYSPPPWLMHELLKQLQQQLPMLNPADLAGVLSGLAALSFRPSNTWLRVWCESGSRLLRGMSIGQLAAAADALSWAGYSPKPWWGRRLVEASMPLLPVATPDELLLLLHAALSLRLQPPVAWLHECYCHLKAKRRQLSLSQVADAAHVLAGMPLPASFVNRHRAWLAGCLGSMQLDDVAALSRAELLYTLYAAGKLRVQPGRGWLLAALQQLHGALGGASPAELVGSFVVFCYFRRQQHTAAAVWLRDCLEGAAGCASEFSDEGLLQLLLACADIGLGVEMAQQQQDQQQQQQQQDQQQQQRQQQPSQSEQQELEGYVAILVDTLVARLPSMSLVQLSQVCKALEAKSSSRRASWYKQLVQACKAAMAARA